MNELLSRDPKYVPISDLASYQERLVDTGYLPTTYEPTGNWDEMSAAASRRADRDSFNTSRSGGSFLAAGPKTLFRYLGYTVPTSVFDGIYGIAKGIVDDAVRFATNPKEVAEEGGLLGGAAVGAGTGALIGSVFPVVGTGFGAAVGGVVGGAAGFFADLFDDDEDEEGDWNQIVGALSPLDEIKSGDAKNLFAALSTVMTASAVLKSVSVAGKAVTAAGGAKQLALREGYKMAARDTVSPGLLNQFTQAALKRRVVGSAALGGSLNAAPEVLEGDFTQAFRDFGTGALIGALAGPAIHRAPGAKTAISKVMAGLEAAPLARIAASPAGKVSQALYTGAAAPTIVARGVAEMSRSGLQAQAQELGFETWEELRAEKPELAREMYANMSGTAIGENIEEAPDLGPAGTLLDITVGSLIFPERLLPWRGRDVAEAFKTLGSNHAMIPFAQHARRLPDGTMLPMSKGMERAKELMGAGADGKIDPLTLGARVNDAYLQYGIELHTESRIAQRAAEFRSKNPYQRLSKQWDEEVVATEERSAVKSEILREVGDTGDVVGRSPTASRLIEQAMANPTGMQNHLASRGYDLGYWADHQKAQELLNSRTAELLENKAAKFTPAVKGEYVTRQDFERFGGTGEQVGEYEQRALAYKTAREQLENADAPTPQFQEAVADSGRALDETLVEMKSRGIIDQGIFDKLRPGAGEAIVENRLVKYLQETAPKRPREITELTVELEDAGLGRYMAIATGENMIDYTHFLNQAEITGITEYSRRKGFFDSLASLGAKVDKADIGRLRYNSIVTHLDNTADDLLNGHNGKSVTDAIYDELKKRYDVDYAKRRGETLSVQMGSVIRREDDATGRVSRELFKVDPRDLSADDIVTALNLDNPGVLKEGIDVYQAADRIKRSLHVGAAFGADVAHPLKTARSLGASLKVNGLPGFNDFMRTTTFVPNKLVSRLPQKMQKGSYGYVPQYLRRFHMALQFSLSPTFDASRYAEAAMFGKMRGGDIPIKAATSPKKFVHDYEEGWISPHYGERIRGKQATDEMVEFGDRVLYGRAANQNFDELQLRLLHRGVLGFKPREVEYAQAWWLAQKKARKGPLTDKDFEEIRETVMQIGQYGTKQTAGGNTAHFIFFPYLFSQKQLSAMVDFTLGAPTRNLLMHEGIRRWYSVTGEDGTTMSEDFAQFMQKHIPLAEELSRINNLAYGVSPGRFFLEGIMDKKTEGKVGQALTSFFVPGGVHQPVADTVGESVQVLKNLFVPVVVVDDPLTGQNANPVLSLVERLVPAYRDLDRWFFDTERHGAEHGLVGAQVSALSGQGTPRAQMAEYLDAKRVMGVALDGLATEAGYASWDSLRSADPGLARIADEIDNELGTQYPAGKRLSQDFTNTTEIKDQALYDIAQKDVKTEAEEAISFVADLEANADLIADSTEQLTQAEVRNVFAPIIREFALGMGNDRQFQNLWSGLGFHSAYGPLRTVEVA